MRQMKAEMPGEEKVRIASFSVTFGFSVRMTDMLMIDFRQAASAEVDPQADYRGDQYTSEREVEQALRWRFPLEMGRARIGGVEFVAHGDRKSTRLNSSHSSISYAVF